MVQGSPPLAPPPLTASVLMCAGALETDHMLTNMTLMAERLQKCALPLLPSLPHHARSPKTLKAKTLKAKSLRCMHAGPTAQAAFGVRDTPLKQARPKGLGNPARRGWVRLSRLAHSARHY
eukprot:2016831-Pyramimonas_sp.AAC.1